MQYNYRGKYDSTSSYVKKDVVSFMLNDTTKYYFCLTVNDNLNPQTPNPNQDTSFWAVLNSQSNFPNTTDDFLYREDIQASDVTDVERYQTLKLKSNRTASEDIELSNLETKLRSKLIHTDDWNKLQDSLRNIQFFLKDSVEGYINQKHNEFQAQIDQFSYKGNYDSTVIYNKKNTVTYQGNSFICKIDSTVNIAPDSTVLETTNWAKIAEKGERGETGYGVGLSPKGTYYSSTQYRVNDLVLYQGNQYRCIADTLGNYPNDVNYWELFLSGYGENLNDLKTDDKSGLVNAINEHETQINLHETRISSNEEKLNNTEIATAQIQQSINAILTDRATSGWIKEILGKTVVNHVPLFDSSAWGLHANVTVNSPTKVTLNADANTQVSNVRINAKGSSTYSALVVKPTEIKVLFECLDSAKSALQTIDYDTSPTFTTPSGTTYINVKFYNSTTGTFVIEKLSLNEGTTPQEFVANVKPLSHLYVKAVGKNMFDKHNLKVNTLVSYSTGLAGASTAYDSTDYIPVIGGQSYTYQQLEASAHITWFDENKNYISGVVTSTTKTVTLPINARYMRVSAQNESINIDNIDNAQLELGTTATTFEPYKESVLPIDTQLYEKDRLYEKNGGLDKKEVIAEKNLDGSLPWEFSADYTGFKRVWIPNFVDDGSESQLDYNVVKYNGTILDNLSSTTTGADIVTGNSNGLFITVADTDSGFTETMSPTSDMWKAIMNGWKYTGDGTTHSWVARNDVTKTSTDIAMVSTTIATDDWHGWGKLIYEKAEPSYVNVLPSNSFNLDTVSHVTLGQGLIVRERVYPQREDSTSVGTVYRINHTSFADSLLNYRTNKLIAIYEDSKDVTNLSDIQSGTVYGYGGGQAYLLDEHYNETKPYYVTYLAQEYQLTAKAQQATIQYSDNINSRVNRLGEQTKVNSDEISILDKEKANREQMDYQIPRFLNGWIHNSGGILLDEFGFVNIQLEIRNGNINSFAFYTPNEWRPSMRIRIPLTRVDNNTFGGHLMIDPDGSAYMAVSVVTTYYINGRYKVVK